MKLHAFFIVVLSMLLFASPRADILEQILVKVNGDIIKKTDLEQRQISVLRQRQPNLRPTSEAELQRALAEITPEVIVNMVDELLLVQRGRELGFAFGPDQFQNIVEEIKKENKIETDEQLQAALTQEGMTMDDLRQTLERQMLTTRVQQQEVMAKVSVSEEEVKQAFNAAKGTYTTPPQVTLRELLIAVPTTDKGVNVGVDDDAKAKAESIRKRLLAGEPFPRIASELSDAASKTNGGLIGPISRGDLSEELQKEIAGLKPGELTPVIRTARGYQVLKLESVSEATVRPFDDVREEISQKIATQKRMDEYQKYIERLRAQAIIDWKIDEVKKAYEVGLTKQQQPAS